MLRELAQATDTDVTTLIQACFLLSFICFAAGVLLLIEILVNRPMRKSDTSA